MNRKPLFAFIAFVQFAGVLHAALQGIQGAPLIQGTLNVQGVPSVGGTSNIQAVPSLQGTSNIPGLPLIQGTSNVPPVPVIIADILSEMGGFESPRAVGRTPSQKGGDPSASGEKGLFAKLSYKTGKKQGTLTLGLTNEILRSGSQSLYVEANELAPNNEGAGIQTNPIPILPDLSYKISIWGRMDPKKPFLIQNPPVYIKMQIDFFDKDKENQIGEPVYLVQPIPGTKTRDPLFYDNKWSELAMEFTTPPEAAFAVVTWRWETASAAGGATGVIFFDDFTITGGLPPVPLIKAIQIAAEAEPASDDTPAQPEKVEPADKPEKAADGEKPETVGKPEKK